MEQHLVELARKRALFRCEYCHFPESFRGPNFQIDHIIAAKHRGPTSGENRRKFALQMEQRRGQEAEADYRQIRRGWCLGDEDFRNELITSAVERVGPSHHSARRQETQQEKAERIVRDELKRRGWQEQDLPDQPKGAKAKVAMARRLRKETTMTLKWIAARLEMGSWTYVSNLLNAGNKNAKLTLSQ